MGQFAKTLSHDQLVMESQSQFKPLHVVVDRVIKLLSLLVLDPFFGGEAHHCWV